MAGWLAGWLADVHVARGSTMSICNSRKLWLPFNQNLAGSSRFSRLISIASVPHLSCSCVPSRWSLSGPPWLAWTAVSAYTQSVVAHESRFANISDRFFVHSQTRALKTASGRQPTGVQWTPSSGSKRTCPALSRAPQRFLVKALAAWCAQSNRQGVASATSVNSRGAETGHSTLCCVVNESVELFIVGVRRQSRSICFNVGVRECDARDECISLVFLSRSQSLRSIQTDTTPLRLARTCPAS